MHHSYRIAGISFLASLFWASCAATHEHLPRVIANQETESQKQDPKQDGKKPDKAKQDSKKPDKAKQDSRKQDSRDQSSPTASKDTTAALSAYLSSNRRQFLGRTPRMFGDWFGPGIGIATSSQGPSMIDQVEAFAQIPQSGRVGKIAENNSALPFDRFFVNYSYFHNAYDASVFGPDPLENSANTAINRYTVGMERTFLDGLASLETRFVLSDTPDLVHNPGPSGYQSFSPTLGNISLATKFLLIENECTALAAGLGLELPTGGDTYIKSRSTILKMENRSAYLSPYISLLKNSANNSWFLNAFIQVECPLAGDRISGISALTGDTTLQGKYNSQTSLFVDVAVGRWIYQQEKGLVTGIATFIEGHYNGSLNEADAFNDTISDGSFNTFYALNPLQRQFNIVNLTAGLHIEIADQTKLRIGSVFPVSEQRAFDGEFGIQLSRYR
ncbi:MAG: hypothetical protein VX438_03670 [Planctomycetota bacterium]|nr:hypothetical protein [Planctomycetota bacterium]